MEFLKDIILAVMVKSATDELNNLMSKIAVHIIDKAVKYVPADSQERYEEEWKAHLNDCPSGLRKIGDSIGCFYGALRLGPIIHIPARRYFRRLSTCRMGRFGGRVEAMRKLLSLPLLCGAGSLMMQVGPHGAGANFCAWLSFWPSCVSHLPSWFDQWGWVIPGSLILFPMLVFAWSGIQWAIGYLTSKKIPRSLDSGEPASQPEYMSAYETLHYIADHSDWGKKTRLWESDRGEDTSIGITYKKIPIFEAIPEFSNGAAKHEIQVLGRNDGNGAHKPIPNTEWFTIGIDLGTIRHKKSQTMAITPGLVPFYTDLKISRSDVHRIWPSTGEI